MKKIFVVAGLSLLVLTACGKKGTQKATKSEEIQTGIPALKAENSTAVVTKRLTFPRREDGSLYEQVIRYQGNQFLNFTIERTTAADEELKNIINTRGVDEAQRLLNESLNKDSEYAKAKAVKGFTSSMTILPSQELKLTLSFDLQTLDLPAVEATPYFANLNLKNTLSTSPEKYISYQLGQGAVESIQPEQ